MNPSLEPTQNIFERYHSPSQRARVITETWAERNLYCPKCGAPQLSHADNNQAARDFSCARCDEVFELKSKTSVFGRTINDGAFETMRQRAADDDSPSFFLLRYRRDDWRAVTMEAIPRMFILPDMVIARKPLSATAKRGPWVGCNIDISRVPASGRIKVIEDGKVMEEKRVVAQWKIISFLGDKKELPQRGWTIDVMREVERLKKPEFSLDDLYRAATPRLSELHPENKHVHDKIRQQLQVLRDAGCVRFIGKGTYQLVPPPGHL